MQGLYAPKDLICDEEENWYCDLKKQLERIMVKPKRNQKSRAQKDMHTPKEIVVLPTYPLQACGKNKHGDCGGYDASQVLWLY
mmetsp:Transcript_3261/g.6212  ORF Transcript_3261/g.6212 Transcript_3261/m.6212 type:complete len:83 (+) Transcript_3261:413-661(+)